MTRLRRAFRRGPSRNMALFRPPHTTCPHMHMESSELSNWSARLQLTCDSIIFVHGLGSNPDTTWRARGLANMLGNATDTDLRTGDDQYVNWVRDFLPDDLSSSTSEDARIFFYNYDSYWKRDAVHTRLRNFGTGLLEHIKGIRRSEEVRTKHNTPRFMRATTEPALGTKPEPGICRIQLWGSSYQAGMPSEESSRAKRYLEIMKLNTRRPLFKPLQTKTRIALLHVPKR